MAETELTALVIEARTLHGVKLPRTRDASHESGRPPATGPAASDRPPRTPPSSLATTPGTTPASSHTLPALISFAMRRVRRARPPSPAAPPPATACDAGARAAAAAALAAAVKATQGTGAISRTMSKLAVQDEERRAR